MLEKSKFLTYHKDTCISCAGCVGLCPQLSLDIHQLDVVINHETCNLCALCVRICPIGALTIEDK